MHTLLHRAHVLCSSWDKFHEKVTFLREIFMKNCYPSHFFYKIVKTFLDKIFIQKKVFYDVPKKELSICLPFLGKHSLELKSKLSRYFSKYFPACRIKVIFKCSSRLNRFLVFKDKIPSNVRSHLLYRYTCSGCNATYIGKTRRHYLVRVFEHLGISLRTHKKFTNNPNNGTILLSLTTSMAKIAWVRKKTLRSLVVPPMIFIFVWRNLFWSKKRNQKSIQVITACHSNYFDDFLSSLMIFDHRWSS